MFSDEELNFPVRAEMEFYSPSTFETESHQEEEDSHGNNYSKSSGINEYEEPGLTIVEGWAPRLRQKSRPPCFETDENGNSFPPHEPEPDDDNDDTYLPSEEEPPLSSRTSRGICSKSYKKRCGYIQIPEEC